MVSARFSSGYESVGHLEGIDSDLTPAFLRLDDEGAELLIPAVGEFATLFQKNGESGSTSTPTSLRFRDTRGEVILGGCRDLGTTVSSIGTGSTRLRADRVVQAGDVQTDYGDVDGMSTEIDGLAAWSGMTTIETIIEKDPLAVVIRAQNRNAIDLGGSPAVTIESSFTHNPMPKTSVHSITDTATLRTRSEVLTDWKQHAAVHHMYQDLMCLVYGTPCFARIASVKREDDQPFVRPGDRRRTWREVYEPTFGRTLQHREPFDRIRSRPLFRYTDTDPEKLASWGTEWEFWSRPTWIAVTTMFQRGTTIEARLLQMGVALEALGYAIWKIGGASGGRPTPAFPSLLRLIVDLVPVEHPSLFGTRTASQWVTEFNRAFKGAKHADNPLPDPSRAYELSTGALNIIRAWLASRLGVSAERIATGFDR